MDRERLEELISDYLEQALTPEELEELTQELRAHPEARRLLLTAADQDLAVQELARSLHRSSTSARSRKAPSSWRGLRPPHAQTAPAYWVAALAAGGVLLAAAFFFASGPPGSDWAKPENGSEARARASKDAEARRIAEREKSVRERDLGEAEARRLDQEARLKGIERRREEIARSAAQPGGDPREQEKRNAEEKRLANDKERIEREMTEAVERARKTGRPTPTEHPEQEKPAQAQEPPENPKAPQGTVAVVATVERVEGDVSIVGKEGKTPARATQGISAGQGVKTGPKSLLVLKYLDGTRLEVEGESVVREFAEEGGKRLFVEKGAVKALVAKQPKGQPMVMATPHGEATILGTMLRLVVDTDPKKGTRLEVEEGKVELRSRVTGKTVEVVSGHYAMAAAGADLVARADASSQVSRKGLALWVRADQGVTLNGSAVSAWADGSGSDRHAVQPVPAQQPTFVPDAVQGHPALRFDGVDDCLTFPCPVTKLPGMTIFLVASTLEERSGGITRAGNAALTWREMENFGVVFLTPFQTKVHFGFGTGQAPTVQSYVRPATLDRAYSLTTATKSLAEQVLFVNGRECLRLSGQNRPIGKCEETGRIGQGMGDLVTHRRFPGEVEGESYFSGEIAEILVYSRALADSERKVVDQYLLGKYLLK
jgi:hypothetical protein